MQTSDRLSVCEKLLLAAYELETAGSRPFSAEQLVVAAWKKFPDAFGLAGYRHPDSNRVFAEVMGSKPIRKRGLLAKVGEKMYQLTEAGREHARLLLHRDGSLSVEKSGLKREVQLMLKRLLGARAVEKYKSGRVQDLTFFDACSFWGISPRSSAVELEGRMSNLTSVLEAARTGIGGKTVTFEHGGEVYRVQDLDVLLEVHQELSRRFGSEIEIIRKRTDERA